MIRWQLINHFVHEFDFDSFYIVEISDSNLILMTFRTQSYN